ncbi:Mediator of RNA polymerase II transcription subunit 13 [Acorus calamus]|uniref:Mediator of RNA polymerase II transcription subunit 13 n=1 Tax=Acorus calamus TaxID=4465 RepID=A0AAV9EGV0_ACOCL|nr:Mediator of RNA polymerase II transcription subunit 13 [Acorus calamus]
MFAATEEAIYVHATIFAKHIRTLSNADVERVVRHHSSFNTSKGLPVIVAPYGMRGRLTGCCPSDLVKQAYSSKVKGSSGSNILGLPFHVAQSSDCLLRGQSCHVEVMLGGGCDGTPQSDSTIQGNSSKQHIEEPSSVVSNKSGQKQGPADRCPGPERTFIYSPETVLVPMLHKPFTRSFLKRLGLQNWVGMTLSEVWPFCDLSGSSLLAYCLGFGSTGDNNFADAFCFASDGTWSQCSDNSSSNSNDSSISSISSSSSDSDYPGAARAAYLEADADSLSCRQSGLSSDQFDNDGRKVSKRLRTGSAEPFGQTGTVGSTIIQSEYMAAQTNNLGAVGMGNGQVGSRWGWDDDDKGIDDIQTLLSEFGDFSDFFENDVLAFGEPPGTAESQALVFSAADYGDVSGSPCTLGMDVSDQALLGYTSFEGFNDPPVAVLEESICKNDEFVKDGHTGNDSTVSSIGKFDHLSKAEAMMTFAPEYSAVETPTKEFFTSIFRSPYLPKTKTVESSNLSSNVYIYGAMPPSSPCSDPLDEKQDTNSHLHSQKLYTIVAEGKKYPDRSILPCNNSILAGKTEMPACAINSSNSVNNLQRKRSESTFEVGHFLSSTKTVLATEVECIMFQAAMCRTRHSLLSCRNLVPNEISRLSGSTISDQVASDTITMTDMMSNRYEVKKRENIPVRIAGDFDGDVVDPQFSSLVGVWRSVPKGTKFSNTSNVESIQSLSHTTFNEDALVTYGQRQPLQEFLDAVPLLVQQSASFFDMALDSCDGVGPYSWLALQEQKRRGFACGPSMVHAGCGGILATCHYVDIAGVELMNPLSADVHASSVISLLQSDIKVSLKSAFANLDGPMSAFDWCKGRSSQSSDTGIIGDGYSIESIVTEAKDSSSTLALGEPMSPPPSSILGPSILKDGNRLEESSQRRSNQEISYSDSEQSNSRCKSTISLLPLPALLVGYQDDWLKTSTNSLQHWEKAPLEPYALPKPVNYNVVCPEIDLLTSAASDFFQQLGTVYESCKLGLHSPQLNGGQLEGGSGKWSSSGFVFVDCPQSMRMSNNNISSIGSVNDYFSAISKNWDVKSFLRALSKVLRTLNLGASSTVNLKEGGGSCTVIYVVCPFPESSAVLQTLIESSTALGSTIFSSDKERRSSLHSQVGDALSCAAAVDEASVSNVLALSGFSIPKLVLHIVTIETILRVSGPISEPTILKEIAFTVYNKTRRAPRASTNDTIHTSTIPGRTQSALMHSTSPVPGLWKDYVSPRITGPTLAREGELDSVLRSGSWDNSWQASRTGNLGIDPNRQVDFFPVDDTRYLFEPLFILSEPGYAERGVSPVNSIFSIPESLNTRSAADDSSSNYMQTSTSVGSGDATPTSHHDGSEHDGLGMNNMKVTSLHCCYGWTEDWRWLICIWTDARGELLDCHIYPFGGISSRQDTKVLQCLFVQVLQQGCQILSSSSPDVGNTRTKDIIITRIGQFYELECQEWQKAIYSVGGSEVKKWPLQLRRSVPDGGPSSNSGSSLQQQDMVLIQERNLPTSPSPSMYSPHAKPSSFMKSSLGQTNTRKQLIAGQSMVDSSRGMFQMVQSISLISISIDHSLNLILPADLSSSGSGIQSGMPSYLEGFSPVKSLQSTPASYLLIPSPSMRFLPTTPLQLPTCLTAESPPLAHLLHSKGSATPVSTGFVVSKPVASIRRCSIGPKDEWPSILSVNLVDHYGGSNSSNSGGKGGSSSSAGGKGRSLGSEMTNKDYETESHLVLESAAAELHALSWMTVSPACPERRSALPFHCDMLLRMRRLLHYADKELFRQSDKEQ